MIKIEKCITLTSKMLQLQPYPLCICLWLWLDAKLLQVLVVADVVLYCLLDQSGAFVAILLNPILVMFFVRLGFFL